jgi:hypothetical protein
VSQDLKVKDFFDVAAGTTVATIATASYRGQQLNKRELVAQTLAQKNRDKLSVVSQVRRNVQDNIFTPEEAIGYCKRADILSGKQCLGFDFEAKKKPTEGQNAHMGSQLSNKTLRGGGNTKVNSHEKISKDGQNFLHDSETFKLINSLEKNSLSNCAETSELSGITPKSEISGIAVSASPAINAELKTNEVWVPPASAPFIVAMLCMVLYGSFFQIRKKNTRIKNFFATDMDKIIEKQNKMQEKLDEIYSGQEKIKEKLKD